MGQIEAGWEDIFSLVFFFFLNNFTHLFVCGGAGSSLPCGFSLVAVSEGYSLVVAHKLLIAVTSYVVEPGLEHRLSHCTGAWAWQHVASSQMRDRTRVSCIVGGFLPLKPPGNPHCVVFNVALIYNQVCVYVLSHFSLSNSL